MQNVTEIWNGTNWTASPGNLNTARRGPGGAGASSTSALAFGGDIGSGTRQQAVTEAWNGSAWAEVADLNIARLLPAGCGIKDAALAIGGYDFNPNQTNSVESWNETAWTQISPLNTARYNLAATGTTTSSLAFGGAPGPANTELWNGVSWTEVADLNAGRSTLAGAGTTAATVAFGGTPPVGGQTEDWSSSSSTIKVLTD